MTRRLLVALTFLVLLAPVTWAQVSAPPKVIVQDEGATQGAVRTLNCVGTGIACTVSGATATVTASGGGGSFAVTQTEIDFDTCGIGVATAPETCQVTVTDAAISTASKVLAQQAGLAATSRDQDENEMDFLICNVNPGTGNFVLTCFSTEGPTHGKFKIWYTFS